MERKARENIAAARILLKEEEDACPNAAVSRAYYAAYQACWVAMVQKGHEAPEARPGASYFPHAKMPHLARDAGVIDDRQSRALAGLYDLRHLLGEEPEW
jgi:hypothetical protein